MELRLASLSTWHIPLTVASPTIWLVLGDKLGDNTQVIKIADCLGMPYETRRLLPRQQYVLGKPRFRVSLDHLDLKCSDPLDPPWPDLVITAGRRHAMAALWIKAQNPATKIVLLGRPRRWIEKFDLVITLPQYRLPGLDNVMRLSLPLMRADKDAIASAREIWSDKLESLDKPLIAVFVGGPTQPYRFDSAVTRKLISACSALQKDQGGSLYFVTSPRTTLDIVATFKTHTPSNARLYIWKKGDAENPYQALLGLADACIITGDSISMMIEAADQAKPLAIYPLPGHLRGKLWQVITRRLCGNTDSTSRPDIFSRLGKMLYKTGIIGFPRDLTEIYQTLINRGLATYIQDGFCTPATPLPSELIKIRDRIRKLMGTK